jgi:hypothetical protein
MGQKGSGVGHDYLEEGEGRLFSCNHTIISSISPSLESGIRDQRSIILWGYIDRQDLNFFGAVLQVILIIGDAD